MPKKKQERMPMKKAGTLMTTWSMAVTSPSSQPLRMLPARMPRGMESAMVKAKESRVRRKVMTSFSPSMSDTGMW